MALNDGICPQCGKREVRRSPDRAVAGQRHSLSITAWSGARLVVYVCTACGHVEDRIEDRAALDRIAERWTKVR